MELSSSSDLRRSFSRRQWCSSSDLERFSGVNGARSRAFFRFSSDFWPAIEVLQSIDEEEQMLGAGRDFEEQKNSSRSWFGRAEEQRSIVDVQGSGGKNRDRRREQGPAKGKKSSSSDLRRSFSRRQWCSSSDLERFSGVNGARSRAFFRFSDLGVNGAVFFPFSATVAKMRWFPAELSRRCWCRRWLPVVYLVLC